MLKFDVRYYMSIISSKLTGIAESYGLNRFLSIVCSTRLCILDFIMADTQNESSFLISGIFSFYKFQPDVISKFSFNPNRHKYIPETSVG